MPRTRLACCVLAVTGLVLPLRFAGAEGAQEVAVALVDFAYIDTSGEPGNQQAVHQRQLQALMAALRRDFVAGGNFRLVPAACGSAACTVAGAAPEELIRAASDAGAQFLVLGGIHKQSTLVQWAKVEAVDLAANRVVFDKLFTFRGDSDAAWDRAETFMSEEIRGALMLHGN